MNKHQSIHGWYSLSKAVLSYSGCILIILVVSQKVQGSQPWPFEITAECRPGTYWWWPGSALDKENMDWNLEAMQKAGFGTLHIVPIYGAKGYEHRYIDFLSPRWMEMLDYVVGKADQLGMQVDMTTGTGWNFGGPNIPAQYRAIRTKNGVAFEPGLPVERAAPGGSCSITLILTTHPPYWTPSTYRRRSSWLRANPAARPRRWPISA